MTAAEPHLDPAAGPDDPNWSAGLRAFEEGRPLREPDGLEAAATAAWRNGWFAGALGLKGRTMANGCVMPRREPKP